MKECCVYCLTMRERSAMFEEQPGAWMCSDVLVCLENYANLPEWLRV